MVGLHSLMNKGRVQTWNAALFGKELAEAIIRNHNAKKNQQVTKGGGLTNGNFDWTSSNTSHCLLLRILSLRRRY